MRYRLRTLLIATTFGPPALAWGYLHGREREKWGYILAAFLVGVAVSLVILVWQGRVHPSIFEDRQR
jgi:membrane protease YdiL (CAAX protease family)